MRVLLAFLVLLSGLSLACGKHAVGQQPGQTAAALAKKDGQTSMGPQWGVRYAVITDASLPRVLLVGDSIVNGYGSKVAMLLKSRANVDIWVTPSWLSKDLDQQARDVLQKQQYSVIHFNESGLHAWDTGRIPDGQYGPLMSEYLSVLHSANPHAKLIWASTTPVTAAGKPGELDPLDKLISERNAVCVPIMQKDGIPIDDLHSLMMDHLDWARGDRFHWVDKGYDLMAATAARMITEQLPPQTSTPRN